MKTKTKKKSRKDYDLERDADLKRLRGQLARLIAPDTKPGGFVYDYKPATTFRMFCILMRIDEAMVGTADYMGFSGWWSQEYKHTLREATPRERKKAHDAIVAAGLVLDGESEEHGRIIAWATNNGKRAAVAMGCKWAPYRGPRPAKREVAR